MVLYIKYSEADQYNQPKRWWALQFSQSLSLTAGAQLLLCPVQDQWVWEIFNKFISSTNQWVNKSLTLSGAQLSTALETSFSISRNFLTLFASFNHLLRGRWYYFGSGSSQQFWTLESASAASIAKQPAAVSLCLLYLMYLPNHWSTMLCNGSIMVHNLPESFDCDFVQETSVLHLVARMQRQGSLLIHRICTSDSALTLFYLPSSASAKKNAVCAVEILCADTAVASWLASSFSCILCHAIRNKQTVWDTVN